MQFSAATLLAFVASAVAQITTPNDPNPAFNPVSSPASGQEVQAGSALKIQWAAPAAFADVKVAIELIGGKEQNLQAYILTVGAGIPNSANEFDWTVPSDIGGLAFYGLKVISEANPEDWQYSNPFKIIANPDASDAASASATVTTTVTTASGTATVTLSVASVTSSAVSSSSEIESSSVVLSSSALPNTTLTTVSSSVVAPTTIQTVSTTPTQSSPAVVESSQPAEVEESGATATKVGIFALFGGVAAAFML